MGSRIGLIFHDNWEEFSPLMYHHFGENSIPFEVQKFIQNYYDKHNTNTGNGHEFSPGHMMVEFLQTLDKNIHMRVQNISDKQIKILKQNYDYPNYFDGGCYIINIAKDRYGETICGEGYFLDNNNILTDKLKNQWDLD
jgi:hypothetical protein